MREIAPYRDNGDTPKPKPNAIERSKIVLAVVLEQAALEMAKRLMDPKRRAKIRDKELGDWVDKTAKYILPRDIRIRVSDPAVLQAIAGITAELMPEDVFQTWLSGVQIALEGAAISKHAVTTGVDISDVVEGEVVQVEEE